MSVDSTPAERSAALPGDDLVPGADVVMDRAFDLPAPPAEVWPWLAQLGKRRAGWYLPRPVERCVPRSRRAFRHVEDALTHLQPGDVIPDWGGRDATFEVVRHDPPSTLVHRSQRGDVRLSWAIVVRPVGADASRVHLRLRLGGVRRRRLAGTVGGAFDLLTVAGLAAGLRERVGAPNTM